MGADERQIGYVGAAGILCFSYTPQGVHRAHSPLRRQPFTHPSAFGHRCYNTLHPSGMGINRIYFPSIALLISPDALYIYLGWGSPSGPPACLSTLRQTLLLSCSLILIWRFRPHSRQTLSNLPSPLSVYSRFEWCLNCS